MSLAFGSAVGAIFIVLFRWEIARAYTSDPAVQELCVRLLLLAALFQLSDATQVAASSAIRGYKVTRSPMLIQLLAFWGSRCRWAMCWAARRNGFPGRRRADGGDRLLDRPGAGADHCRGAAKLVAGAAVAPARRHQLSQVATL
jgi:hypothetical protein